MLPFHLRIASVSLLLAVLTVLVIWRGPATRAVQVVTHAPTGAEIAVNSPIRVTFSRPVDRRSVEARFTLEPPVVGRFIWSGQTLTFVPQQPLRPATDYRVVFAPGIVDQAAQSMTQAEITWHFRTRSPRLLLLRHAEDGSATLWLTERDGRTGRAVLREPGGILEGAVAPDGQHALLTLPRPADRTALVLVALEDGTQQPLVDDEQVSASTPAWAPDGSFIAFEQRFRQTEGWSSPAIWVMQPDGTPFGPLTTSEQVGFAPVWAPDSRQVAFLDAVTQHVTVVALPSSSQTFADSVGGAVTWAPDASALIYTSSVPGDDSRTVLRRATISTGKTTVLTGTQAGSAHQPAWSPDGAWVSLVRSTTPEAAGTLWLMRPDGSEQRQISTPGPNTGDQQPVWSPDSQHIAFLRVIKDSSTRNAWVVEHASGAAQQVGDDVVQVVWVP
jgi:Tol biopolymer transport system component